MTPQNTDFSLRTLLGEQTQLLLGELPIGEAIVEHGDVERLEAITSIAQLRTAETLMNAWDGAARTARAWSPPTGKAFQVFATKDQVRTLYEAGYSIILGGVERFIPELRALCRVLEQDLGIAPGEICVEAFCARAGGRGRAHFDPGYNLNCQIRGEKTWRTATNPAVQFPPTGMFLGKPPCEELERLLDSKIPSEMQDPKAFVAKPGTVVCIPSGLLHDTLMDTDSFAINFSIEQTATVASAISKRVQDALDLEPMLRAPRLGPQRSNVQAEMQFAAARLREIADQIDSTTSFAWPTNGVRVRRRQGMSFFPQGQEDILITTENAQRHVNVGPLSASLLALSMSKDTFTLVDALVTNPTNELTSVRESINALTRAGLLEIVV